MLTKENVNALRKEYMDSLASWDEQAGELQSHYGDLIQKSWQKSKYISRNLPFAPEKIAMCPPNSILNFSPNQQHRIDYATGVWEGSSAEPISDENNNIVNMNVILHQPRLERFQRSLKARGYKLSVPIEHFGQSILDTVAIHGTDVMTSDDGTLLRAYIRPSAGSGVGPWGVSLSPGHFIESSVLVFRWGSYFPDVERIEKEGARAVITGMQRMFPIIGKHASNYGAASTDGALARNMEYDELLYLAPYSIKNNELDFNVRDFSGLMKHGVLSDGPGEELIAILKDGETLIYPPKRVNRLGGTVLDYIVKHLAPKLGYKVREQDITLDQLRSGEILGMAFVGNAVKVSPIGKIDIVKPKEGNVLEGDKVETVFEAAIHPAMIQIRDQFADELNGRKPPSHESLLTPIDLKWGNEFRQELDDYWSKLGL